MKSKLLQANSDWEKVCRLCLKIDAENIEIFNQTDNVSLPLRIMACTSLEVQFSDFLPKVICHECRIQLEKSYYFRKKSQQIDNKLREHVRLINGGKKSKLFQGKFIDFDEYEFQDSILFLRKIEEDEKIRQNEEKLKYEEEIKENFRLEETNRIIEEVKTFYNSKLVRRSKTQLKIEVIPVEMSKDNTEKDITMEKESNLYEDGSNPTNEKYVKFLYPDDDNDDLGSTYSMTDLNRSRTCGDNDDLESTYYLIKNDDDDDEDEGNDNEQIENVTLRSYSFEETNNESGNIKKDHEDFSEDIEYVADDDETNLQDNKIITDEIEKSSSDNLKIDEDLEYNVEKVSQDDITHVKITTTDEGNFIFMELQADSTKSVEEKPQPPPPSPSPSPSSPRPLLIEHNTTTTINEDVKIFKCNACPQSFTRRSLLMRHRSVHVKSKGYSCKYCEKWFACKSSMDRHIRVHTGEKPFACELCQRRFIQKEILKRHMVTHTGLRPHKCPHCEKAFVQKQLLRQHINLKHTEKPVVEMHECFLCPKVFYHASGLSRHLLVHCGVSYNCKICDKKFNDKSAVRRHTMTVHNTEKNMKND